MTAEREAMAKDVAVLCGNRWAHVACRKRGDETFAEAARRYALAAARALQETPNPDADLLESVADDLETAAGLAWHACREALATT